MCKLIYARSVSDNCLDLNRKARPWTLCSGKGRFERIECNRRKEVCLFAIRLLPLPQGNRHDNIPLYERPYIRGQLKWEHSVSLDFSVPNVPGILSEIDPPMNGPLVSSI